MGKLVCDSTEFSCTLGTKNLKLKVASSSAKYQGKKAANKTNCSFPPPGGNCKINPQAPPPCVPSVTVSSAGQSPLKIDGSTALGAGCKFKCARGGSISVASPGQSKANHS